jgi:hypothetical protein
VNENDAPISRLVLVFAMLMCFGPVTWRFASVFWLQESAVSTLELSLYVWTKSMIGPIGLIIAFKSVVLRRPLLHWATVTTLCVAAAWSLMVTNSWLPMFPPFINNFYGLVLLGILPAVGAAYLVYAAVPRDRQLAIQ